MLRSHLRLAVRVISRGAHTRIPRVESQTSQPTRVLFSTLPSRYFSTSTLTFNHTMERTQKVLSAAAITPAAIVSHAAATSPQAWSEALQSPNANPSVPAQYSLTKVLVFKPKTAKNAVPVPVVIVAADKTEVNSGALAKKLNLKEMRLASEDLLKEFFALDKDSCKYGYIVIMIATHHLVQ